MSKLQVPSAYRCACKFDENDNATSMCSHHRYIIAAAATLFDHYLNAYEQNDGQRLAGERDHLGKCFEELVPDWRKMRDDWPGLM
jgi:hypothetical protein